MFFLQYLLKEPEMLTIADNLNGSLEYEILCFHAAISGSNRKESSRKNWVDIASSRRCSSYASDRWRLNSKIKPFPHFPNIPISISFRETSNQLTTIYVFLFHWIMRNQNNGTLKDEQIIVNCMERITIPPHFGITVDLEYCVTEETREFCMLC